MGEHPRCGIAALCVLCLGFIFSALMPLYTVTSAHAEAMCAEYKQLQEMLMKQGQEQPIGAGIMGGGKAAMALFTSPNGDNWTMVVVGTAGKACIVGAGQHWADIGAASGEPT